LSHPPRPHPPPRPTLSPSTTLFRSKLRPDLPLINLSQAAPAGPPPESLRRHLAEAMLEDSSAHLYGPVLGNAALREAIARRWSRSEEHTSELQSREKIVCRLLLEKK